MARSKTQAAAPDFIPCRVAQLPEEDRYAAARSAASINPANRPPPPAGLFDLLADTLGEAKADKVSLPHPDYISALSSKWFGPKGRKLGVSFLEPIGADLRDRLLSHMNAWWDKGVNVPFAWSQSMGEIRITREADGYWSYLAVDCLQIPRGQPTMSLQAFSMATPDTEFYRVVRHETGHVLGCPHEHMRQEIVSRLDPEKTIAYFQRTQGWSRQTVIQQVLTPLSEASLMGTPHAEVDSIMCYQLGGNITRDGRPIPGGTDITEDDAAFMQKLYPRDGGPVVGPTDAGSIRLDLAKKTVFLPVGWTAQTAPVG